MNLSDSAAYAQLLDTRDRVSGDSSRSFYQKAQDLSPMAASMFNPEASAANARANSTFGDVLRIAVGAALGFGVARGASNVLGLSDSTSSSLAVAGASLGGLVGLSKTGAEESEQREAFRAGFIKAAIEKGHFKKAFIGPFLLAPLTGLSQASQRVGTSVGSVLGTSDSPDEVDSEIVRMKVETEIMRQELARVRAVKQNQALKEILAKRLAAA